MQPTGADALLEFLHRETGDRLHIVLRYGPDDWESLYQSELADEALSRTTHDERDLMEAFRDEGRRNTHLDGLFSMGSYYCSLHLFGDLVLLHFGQPQDRGIILGFDPDAASHLTDFVSTVLPFLQEAGLETYTDSTPWTGRSPVSGVGRE